jgi:hypothetical protein
MDPTSKVSRFSFVWRRLKSSNSLAGHSPRHDPARLHVPVHVGRELHLRPGRLHVHGPDSRRVLCQQEALLRPDHAFAGFVPLRPHLRVFGVAGSYDTVGFG